MWKALLALLLLSLASSAARAELVEGDAAVTRARVALRERPGPDYRVVTRVEAGEPVTVERVKGEWVRVKAGSHNGWTPANLLRAAKSSRARSVDGEATPRKRKNAFVTDGQFARRSGADAEEEEMPAPPPRSKAKPRVRAAAAQDEVEDVDLADSEDSPAPSHLKKQRAAKWKQTKSKASVRDRADRDREDEAPTGERAERARASQASASDEDADRTERAERRRSGERRVAAVRKTPLLLAPKAGASPVIMAREGDQMKVLKQARDGHWLFVEVDGTQGWVEEARVKTVDADSDDDEDIPVGHKGLGYLLNASTGFVSLSESFDSDSTAFLAKYRIASAAGTIAIGGLLHYIDGIWEFGGDLSYRFTAATPGVSVTVMGQQQDLSLIVHTLDLGARAGYRSPNGLGTGVYGRLGYHMNAIQIDQTRLAPLPNETIYGFLIGGGLDIPRLSEHMGLRGHADFLVGGGRDQTIGLRDGTEDGSAGVLLGIMLHYRFAEAWAIEGGYQLQYLSTNFRGSSERVTGVTWANRTNTDHILLIGVTYSR